MTMVRKDILMALVMGVMSVTFATQSYAQVSQARRAAIMKCTNMAHAEFPDDDPDAHHGRYLAYEACMTQAGQLP